MLFYNNINSILLLTKERIKKETMRTKTKTTERKDLFIIAKEEREKELKQKRAYYSINAIDLCLLMRQATDKNGIFNAIITAFYYGKVKGKREEKRKHRL